jgi:tRNA A37 threonylcarbamoyladenosine synthetase subunit TsaC/SUA5/YrdC
MSVELRGGKIKTGEFPGRPEYRVFEDVKIQWGKGEWKFNHLELGRITKPTYSILNPGHWREIAYLLEQGKTAASMMMGNYGVFKRLDAPGSADGLFGIKKRPREQNFVALIHPNDIDDIIDTSRLKEPFKTQFLQPEERLKFYAGPQHVILPVKDNKVNSALVREADRTISCFWVPGHFGFEGLVGIARQTMREGSILGGGSLNLHGKDPHYDKDSLCEAMMQGKEWLKEIDFIIFDDIAEAGDIGRSHTMIRYSGEKPEVVRIGSLSINKIRKETGHDIQLGPEVKYASSKTPFSEESNARVDEKVIQVLQRTQRFRLSLQELSVRR